MLLCPILHILILLKLFILIYMPLILILQVIDTLITQLLLMLLGSILYCIYSRVKVMFSMHSNCSKSLSQHNLIQLSRLCSQTLEENSGHSPSISRNLVLFIDLHAYTLISEWNYRKKAHASGWNGPCSSCPCWHANLILGS